MRRCFRYRYAAGISAAILLAVLIGCRGKPGTEPTEPRPQEVEPPDGPAWFEEITEKAGLNFVHDPGDVSKYLMYQSVGSGCAIADLDGDGKPDILLLTNAGSEIDFDQQALSPKARRHLRRCLGRLGSRFRRLEHGHRRRRREQRRQARHPHHASERCETVPEPRRDEVRGRERGSRHHQSAVGNFGRVSRLRPRRLARYLHRQLRRLRSVVAVPLRDRRARLLRPEGLSTAPRASCSAIAAANSPRAPA